VHAGHGGLRVHARKARRVNPLKLIGIVLVVAGVLGLLYGGFSYTKQTHDVKLGPIELSLKEKQSVSVPTWAGVAAIVAGVALLVFGGRKG
jgi:drug/metabolite transporter (DMT)-like permease